MLKLLTFFLTISQGYPSSTTFEPQRPRRPTYRPERSRDRTGDKVDNSAFTAAQDEAIHWLNLIDQAQYKGAYDDSGPYLKDIVTRDQWVGAMHGTRAMAGHVLSRQVDPSHQSLSALPGGTRGNFMQIKYNTQFSNNATATEVVTLMTDPQGNWRVIGYTITQN